MNRRESRPNRKPFRGGRWTLACACIVALLWMTGCAAADVMDPIYEEVVVEGQAIVVTSIVAQEPDAESGIDGGDSDPSSSDSATKPGAQSIERLIVREADIGITVEDTRAARDVIQAMVKDMSRQGAYVVSSVEGGGSQTRDPTIYMTIRVPVDQYDEAMFRIVNMAIFVTSRTETSQDVTEQYYDTLARLESMEAARDRLLAIMAGAETTEDLLDIEQQLTQREAEIEGLKGRLQYLSQTAQFSKITMTISPFIPTPSPTSTPTPWPTSTPVIWKPGETAKDAFDGLVGNMQGFIDFLLVFTIAVLPWMALFGLVVYVVFRLGVRVFNKYLKNESEPK